jgi:catechol 2,3-dioxygenase-like lactoylglutathione lyase family enzyme
MRLHHTQVSMPSGGEGVARQFYRDALGLVEVDKPASLAGRGGCWFRSYSEGTVSAEIHLGVEDPFTPARKAHPALVVESVDALERLAQRVAEHGFEVNWAERDTLEHYVRFHCKDGFGNRVELMAPR